MKKLQTFFESKRPPQEKIIFFLSNSLNHDSLFVISYEPSFDLETEPKQIESILSPCAFFSFVWFHVRISLFFTTRCLRVVTLLLDAQWCVLKSSAEYTVEQEEESRHFPRHKTYSGYITTSLVGTRRD